MARGVAGAEVDIQLALAKLHLVTLLKPAIRREGGGMGEAEHLALLGQHIEPEDVFLMRAGDGDAGLFPQSSGGTHMIQMTVGQQDMSQGQAALGDGSQQFVRFAARIDQGGLMGLVTPDEERFWANWVTGITSNFNIEFLSWDGSVAQRAGMLLGEIVETGLFVTAKHDALLLVAKLVEIHGVVVAGQQQGDPARCSAVSPLFSCSVRAVCIRASSSRWA